MVSTLSSSLCIGFRHPEFRCLHTNHRGAIATRAQKKEESIPSVQQKEVWIVSKQGKKHGKVCTCNYSSPGQQNHHYFRKIRNDTGVPAQPPSVSIVTTAMSCLLNYPHKTSSVSTSWRDESYRPNTNV